MLKSLKILTYFLFFLSSNLVFSQSIDGLQEIVKLQQDKIKHDKDFYVFTGSSVGVVPILSKGIYKGKIEKLGSVKTRIN